MTDITAYFLLALVIGAALRIAAYKMNITRARIWVAIAVWAGANAYAAKEREKQRASGFREAMQEFS